MGIYIKGSESYPAVVRRCGAVFEARFIDLPNCVAIASSAPEAEKRAQTALTAYAAIARRHAWIMPQPSTPKQPSNLRDNYVAYISLLPAADIAVSAVIAV